MNSTTTSPSVSNSAAPGFMRTTSNRDDSEVKFTHVSADGWNLSVAAAPFFLSQVWIEQRHAVGQTTIKLTPELARQVAAYLVACADAVEEGGAA